MTMIMKSREEIKKRSRVIELAAVLQRQDWMTSRFGRWKLENGLGPESVDRRYIDEAAKRLIERRFR